jgi:hypothetical protein
MILSRRHNLSEARREPKVPELSPFSLQVKVLGMIVRKIDIPELKERLEVSRDES